VIVGKGVPTFMKRLFWGYQEGKYVVPILPT